ncbi:MAG: adenylate/guanylate cyclase domain-containing protein [Alphaproteobacteria bacterium]|jgi:class 3 adenylate cyclase|nr:adenylate/guanylate cyclase domain-containing protein [Alphaproteobacteria bacterium]
MRGAGALSRAVPAFARLTPGPISIATALALTMGGLVAIAVAIVLAIAVGANARNTLELMTDAAELVLALEERAVRDHLDPAAAQLEFLAALMRQGRVDPADTEALLTLLSGAAAATPQTLNVLLFDPQLQLHGIVREAGSVVDISGDPTNRDEVRQAFQSLRNREDGMWGPVVYLPPVDQSAVTRVHPVRLADDPEDQLDGVLVATVPLQALSQVLRGLAEQSDGGTPFILVGRERVLAHPNLLDDYPGLSQAEPLPSLFSSGDPVLPAIWSRAEPAFVRPADATALTVTLGTQDYLVLYREVAGYGSEPLILGIHYPMELVSRQLDRLAVSGAAGLGVLLLAVGAAILLGHRLARPVKQAADQALAIAAHADPDRVRPIPGSVFRELNNQARAFNTMLRGLGWLYTYVPRRLVEHLVAKGPEEQLESVDRALTVLFTDIAGYTGLAEHLPAAETAALLNRHFALIGACVEAEGGTIDKFVGDSLMAFWNAPDPQPDHADRACRAALAIAAAIRNDNAARRAAGQEPVRLRIGIHTGRMVAGNIGAPGRMNYTIVGDAVNTGSRLEQLGKVLGRETDEAVVLVSEATAAALAGNLPLEDCGRHALRGRHGEIGIFRLG